MHDMRQKVRMDPRNPGGKRPKILANDPNIPDSTELCMRPSLGSHTLETPRVARIPINTCTIDFPSVRLQAVEKAKSELTEEWEDHTKIKNYDMMVADLDACGFIHQSLSSGCGSHPLPAGLQRDYKKKKRWFFTHHGDLYLLKQKFDLHWILAWRWENDCLF